MVYGSKYKACAGGRLEQKGKDEEAWQDGARIFMQRRRITTPKGEKARKKRC
jgi:hypothetical protein